MGSVAIQLELDGILQPILAAWRQFDLKHYKTAGPLSGRPETTETAWQTSPLFELMLLREQIILSGLAPDVVTIKEKESLYGERSV
jgi:hypothetical protein